MKLVNVTSHNMEECERAETMYSLLNEKSSDKALLASSSQ